MPNINNQKYEALTEQQKSFIHENCHEMNISEMARSLNVPRHNVNNYCRINRIKCAKYYTSKVSKDVNVFNRDRELFNVHDKKNWLL